MPTAQRTFRVFVSSTFTDMRAERRELQEKVFPRLENLCQEHGCSFQAVDLRWGVGEEAQYDHKTMDICLNEIARCQKLSPKPNFIILLGDKYGWRPLPSRIPGSEMSRILEALKLGDRALLERWYKEDLNAVPTEFLLQPRDNVHRDDSTWQPVEKELKTILRAAVGRLNFTDEQREKYVASATHQEITRGALNPPPEVPAAEEHVFAYLRTINYLPETSAVKEYTDWDGDRRDEDAKKQLKLLQAEIEFKLSADHRYPYSADWQSGKIQLDAEVLDAFSDRVFNDLSRIILRQLVEPGEDDPLQRECKFQEEFRKQRIEHFTGREEALAAINNYLKSEARQIFAVCGPSGSGKTSVMAKSAQEASIEGVTVCRFLGTTSGSSDIFRLLEELIRHIAGEYGDAGSALLQSRENEKKFATIAGVQELFANCLYLASSDRPLIIFLDALDQLADGDKLPDLDWLPSYLPPHVRLVVSALPPVTDQLKQAIVFNLQPMPAAEGAILLDRWLSAEERILQPGQRQAVLGSFDSNGNPLYLRLVFEKVRAWHSYTEKINLPAQIEGMLAEYFTGLETEHGDYLVEKACGYLLCGRYQGLAESELLDILVLDEDCWKAFIARTRPEHREEILAVHRLPSIVWSRLFLDMEPYLAEKDGGGVAIINFYHRQFRDHICKVYLSKEVPYHLEIANYFEKQALSDRKVEELPWQLRRAEKWERLHVCLTTVDMFRKLVTGAEQYELMGYWLAMQDRFDMVAGYQAMLDEYEKTAPAEMDIAQLLNETADMLKLNAKYEGAEPHYWRALAIREKVLGPEHLDTASSLNDLAELLRGKGDYEGAEPHYWRALAIREKVLGPEHPDTASSLNNLALLLHSKGDYESAEPIHRRALDIGEKLLGLEHRDTAASLNNLALLLHDKGDYDVVEPLYRRALAICEKVQGPEHPDTASSLNNLAELLRDKGDYEGAEPLNRRALAICEKVLGPEHPDTASSLHSLVALLQDKGDYDGAEPLNQRALAIFEKAMGPEHPNTAASLNNLALSLQHKDDYEGAEPLYRRSLAICEKVLGPEHPHTASILHNLAFLLQVKGDYDGAEPYYRRELAICEKALGPKHPDTVQTLTNLAKLLKKTNRKGEAQQLNLRVSKIQAAKPDVDSILIRTTALACYTAGEYNKAEEFLLRLLNSGFEVPGTCCHLARICLVTGRVQEAGEYACQAWEKRADASAYVLPRILWLQLEVAFRKSLC